MKRIEIEYRTLLLLILTLFFGACQSDEEVIDGVLASENHITILLNFDQSYSSMSRSLEDSGIKEGSNPLKENAIKSSTVIIYDAKGKELVRPTHKLTTAANKMVKLFVPVDSYIATRLDGELYYQVAVVTNITLPAEVGKTIEELNSYLISADFNSVQQEAFVMKGLYKGTIVNKQKIDIVLKRKASKIVANYPILSHAGAIKQGTVTYTLSTDKEAVAVKLHNYRKQGSLLSDIALPNASLYETDYRIITSSDKDKKAFYSYAADWSDDISDQVYLTYKLKLVNSTNLEEKEYLYTVPLEFTHATGEVNSELKPNHYYQITPHIGKVEDTPFLVDPITVTGSYSISDWTTKELLTEISGAHYFVLKEHKVVMPNTEVVTVDFAATTSVKVVEGSLKAWYIDYNSRETLPDGLGHAQFLIENRQEFTPDDIDFPKVTIDNFSSPKSITIHSPLPDNFSPRHIRMEFVDEHGLKDTLRITQYPARYITGRRSENKDLSPHVHYKHNGAPEGSAVWNQNNFNLFTVHTIAGGDFIIGDPTYEEWGRVYTRTDKESNQLISPGFVIASQRSIFDRVTYEEYIMVGTAKERCANYAEGGIDIGKWRIPTEAEIRYINDIQDSPTSPVKDLLVGQSYWSAAKHRYYDFNQKSWVGIYSDDNTYEPAGGEKINLDMTYSHLANYFYYAVGPEQDPYNYSWSSSRLYYTSYVRCVSDFIHINSNLDE